MGGGEEIGLLYEERNTFFRWQELGTLFQNFLAFWVFEKFNKNLKSVKKVCAGNEPQTSQVISRYGV